MPDKFCPLHDAVDLPDEPTTTVFFGMRGPEVIDARNEKVCTCDKGHTPVITTTFTETAENGIEQEVVYQSRK